MKVNTLPKTYVSAPTQMAAQLSALTRRPVIVKQHLAVTVR